MDFRMFTERTRTVLQKAHNLSKDCGYAQIEPEVVMVAMSQESKDMLSFVFQSLGVDKTQFFVSVGDSLRTMSSSHPATGIDFSHRTIEILNNAVEEARKAQSDLVHIEHVFIAMCEDRGALGEIFHNFGISLAMVRNAVEAYTRRNEEAHQNNTNRTDNNVHYQYLSQFSQDLCKMADDGDIENAIGRDEEIRRVMQIVARKTKNNPVLVGEPGVGKTAIVEGLAHRINNGDVPLELKEMKIYSLDVAGLVAGTSHQGEFEERLKGVIKDVSESSENILLFIDEIHLLIGAGKNSGAMDAANILKPELARGKIKVIGATTLDEYRKHIESDAAFERRFQKVVVDEPTEEDALVIMRGIKKRFEEHHGISNKRLKEKIKDIQKDKSYLDENITLKKLVSKLEKDILNNNGTIENLKQMLSSTTNENFIAQQSKNIEQRDEINSLESQVSKLSDERYKLTEELKKLTEELNNSRLLVSSYSSKCDAYKKKIKRFIIVLLIIIILTVLFFTLTGSYIVAPQILF